MSQSAHIGTKAGTIGGTLLSIIPNLTGADIAKTIILAAIGAVVSFGISILMKWIVKAFGKRPTSNKSNS
ncbi:hypothetical protein [Marinoscillum sp.]|uniref:hypothetical protein n=1 Tax=Marinoscillum sp. TaxID=2024838 RepID=UPI003BAA72E6